MLDFSQFEYLTFDCYGTLINWEAGILSALQPILAAHKIVLSDNNLLELYGEFEAEAESGDFKTYRQILSSVVSAFGTKFNFSPTDAEIQALPQSLAQWPPFPDTVEALRKLHTRYKLAVISNVDDDLFAPSAKLLHVPFDAVITAQQARSYKPSLNNFQLAFQKIGMPQEKILHVAQSLYHDIAPARKLGLHCVWVNRRANQTGPGASKPAIAQPDLEVPDLKTLADIAVPNQ
jgi:2-haloacid dehalogenase